MRIVIANEGVMEENKRGEDYIIMKEGRRYKIPVNIVGFSTTYFKEYGILIEKEAPKIISVGEVYEAKSTLELLTHE